MALEHNTQTPDIETASADYRSRFTGSTGAYFLEVQRQAVMVALQRIGRGPLKILELGGGHGQVTEALLEAGHEVCVHGSDASCFTHISPLRERYSGRLNFIASSLWSVPFEDSRFDVVIALRLLAHIERRAELLAEMARLSSRAVIVDFPAVKALNALSPMLFFLKRNIERNTRPYFSYREEELQEELRGFGFESFFLQKQFFFPMGLHRALKTRALSMGIESVARGLRLTSSYGSPVLLLAQRAPN